MGISHLADEGWVRMLPAFLVTAFAFIILRRAWLYKNIWLEEEGVRIKGLQASIHVPYPEIQSADWRGIPNPRMVCIHLKKAGPFGKDILFIPRTKWVFGLDKAVLNELKARIEQANAETVL